MGNFKTKVGEIQAVYHSLDQLKVKITSSQESYQEALKCYRVGTIEMQEEIKVIFLNRANNTLGWSTISVGGVSSAICDPKVVFSRALVVNASQIILVHNHPSGVLTPSTQDDRLTRTIKECGEILQMPLIDHLVITKDSYYSYADQGKL